MDIISRIYKYHKSITKICRCGQRQDPFYQEYKLNDILVFMAGDIERFLRACKENDKVGRKKEKENMRHHLKWINEILGRSD